MTQPPSATERDDVAETPSSGAASASSTSSPRADDAAWFDAASDGTGEARGEVESSAQVTVDETPSRDMGAAIGHFALEVAETIVLTLLIFVCMRGVIQNYRIEGFSMEPNLHQGQYLIVNKAAYYFDGPQRGDIIVFESPWTVGPEERDYIKRVIGLPGDTIEIRDGRIYVNESPIEEPYGPNPINYQYQSTALGPGEYFVLGDNRSASRDSHLEGPLERRYIIGKAAFIYLPIDSVGPVPNATINAAEPAAAASENPG